jgi:hypothetical protein
MRPDALMTKLPRSLYWTIDLDEHDNRHNVLFITWRLRHYTYIDVSMRKLIITVSRRLDTVQYMCKLLAQIFYGPTLVYVRLNSPAVYRGLGTGNSIAVGNMDYAAASATIRFAYRRSIHLSSIAIEVYMPITLPLDFGKG